MKLVKTIAGSRLHGTATGNSDWDYRSVSFEPIEDLLGLGRSKPKHTIFNGVDTIDYPLGKFVEMCLSANPSVIEILFTPEKYQLEDSDAWMELYKNRHLFLSKRIRNTFRGFADQEFRRLKTYTGEDDSKRGELVREYGYDTKSAYNIYRLLDQGCDILTYGDYSPILHPLKVKTALKLREGVYDLGFVVDWLNSKFEEFDEIFTGLPDNPDKDRVEKILIDIYLDYLEGVIDER